MEINSQRSHWKTYLAIAGIIILVISLVYTSYLAQRLREGERNKALLLFDAYQTINDQSNPESPDLEADLTLPTNIIVANNDIPIMVVSETDEVLYAKNFGEDLDSNQAFLKEKLVVLKKKGPEPTEITDTGIRQYLYYRNSRLHDLLTYPSVALAQCICRDRLYQCQQCTSCRTKQSLGGYG